MRTGDLPVLCLAVKFQSMVLDVLGDIPPSITTQDIPVVEASVRAIAVLNATWH
jgi:hypothetical protein